MQLDPDDQAAFDRIAARVSADVARLGPALRELAGGRLGGLLAGEFSQIVALLPRWLADLAPLDGERCDRLGRAGLYAWWYGQIVDDILDGGERPEALPVAQVALLRAIDAYRGLGLLAGDSWQDLLARADASAGAYACELAPRPVDPATVTDEHLARWTPLLIIERASPAGFVVTAQLALAAPPRAAELRADIDQALRCLTGARQIADDASDWLADLKAGQLNFVAAGLIRHFRRHTDPAEREELTLERLAGYELGVEPYWEELARTYEGLCETALARLAAYGPCRLRALIERQRAHDRAVFGRMRARREALRLAFTGEAGRREAEV
jgi:hypothetical protein